MDYFHRLTFINLKRNIISTIHESFITSIYKSKAIRQLDLAQNRLSYVPKEMQKLKRLEKIWLSENPFHCDCDMTWMMRWLSNFTTTSREHVIVDYQDVKCHSGKMVGFPIYQLNEVKLQCFPSELSLKQKIGFGSAGGIGLLIIIALSILVVRKYRDIKFFFYHYFKWFNCIGVPEKIKMKSCMT